MKRIFLCILLVFSLTGMGEAATYNIGPGQTYTTFTLLIASENLTADDVVDGGNNTFREQWEPDGSGSSGQPITIRNATILGSVEKNDTGDWASGDEMHTANNAASDAHGEADATTGWTDSTGGTLASQGATVDTGSYALECSANSNGERVSFDFNNILDVGVDYTLVIALRHSGSGGDWYCSMNDVAWEDGSETVITTLDNTETTFANYTLNFTHSATTRWLNIGEENVGNDGGVFIDNLTVTQDTPTLWYAGSLSLDVGNLIMDGESSFGVRVTNKSDLDTQGDFWWDDPNNRVYIYSPTNPATHYNGDIEVAQKYHALVNVDNRDYITLQNLTVKYSGGHAIQIKNGSDNCIVENCNISYIGGSYLTGTTRYGNGIELGHSNSSNTVRQNFVSQCYDAGITAQGDGATQASINIRNNVVSNCEMAFEFYITTSGSFNGIYVDNNTAHGSGTHWAATQRTETARGRAINFGTSAATVTNFFVRNNILSEGTEGLIRIDGGFNQADNLDIDYNQWYDSTGYSNCFYWEGTTCDSFSDWQGSGGTCTTAHSQSTDANSATGDPKLLKPGGLNARDYIITKPSLRRSVPRVSGVNTDYFGWPRSFRTEPGAIAYRKAKRGGANVPTIR